MLGLTALQRCRQAHIALHIIHAHAVEAIVQRSIVGAALETLLVHHLRVIAETGVARLGIAFLHQRLAVLVGGAFSQLALYVNLMKQGVAANAVS